MIAVVISSWPGRQAAVRTAGQVLAARPPGPVCLPFADSSKGEQGTLSLPVKLQGQGVGAGLDERFQTWAVLNTVFPITGKESSLLLKMITMEHLPFLFQFSNLVILNTALSIMTVDI